VGHYSNSLNSTWWWRPSDPANLSTRTLEYRMEYRYSNVNCGVKLPHSMLNLPVCTPDKPEAVLKRPPFSTSHLVSPRTRTMWLDYYVWKSGWNPSKSPIWPNSFNALCIMRCDLVDGLVGALV